MAQDIVLTLSMRKPNETNREINNRKNLPEVAESVKLGS